MRRLALLPAAALVLAGCGGGGSKHSIVLYNGQHSELTNALISAFQNQTGIAVKVRTNDTVVLADQLLQEGSASPADVYLAENSPELQELAQRHLLAKLSSATLAHVPRAYSSPAGDWVGVALRVSSLVCDPALMPSSQPPKSILDLSQPQWKGKIAIAPTDSDFPPVVSAVIAKDGEAAAEAWLNGLKHNAQTYQDEESVVAAVNRGDVACGIINQYYWYRLQLELGAKSMHSKLFYFPPSDAGSVTNVSGAAVLASSGNKTDADRFVAFLVSPSAQKIIAGSDDFEYPARPGISPNAALPPLKAIAHSTIPVGELGNDQRAAQMIQASGLL
jgi:iron(III) transport system substrate-binding protein